MSRDPTQGEMHAAHVQQRKDALDAFLGVREREGFKVETRTELQAIIAPRRRLPGPLGRLRADGRLVVSVDEHGAVSSSPAEPRRW